jgi:hypothetical protein
VHTEVGLELTEAKLAELQTAFNMLDMDSSGGLSTEELPGLLAAMDIDQGGIQQVLGVPCHPLCHPLVTPSGPPCHPLMTTS